jgi:hypothetical protein
VLDVYLYVMGDTVVGSDATGATGEIVATRILGAQLEELLARLPGRVRLQ